MTNFYKIRVIRKILLCFIIFLAIFSPQSFSLEQPSFKKVLENGLTVLIKEMPQSDVVSVYALVKTGSAMEGKFLGTGVSHFLEHMLFKGTATRKVGQIAAQIQGVGGTINASTGMDYTIFTVTVPANAFSMALEILSDALMNSTFDPKEFEKEREVIFGELRLNNDDPDNKLNRITFQNVYLRHPYRHPIIGYDSLLKSVTREDLLEYYHSCYIPNNIILSVAGNIQSAEIFPQIEKSFQGFKRQPEILRNLPQEPPQISERRYEEEYPTDLTRLTINFHSVNLLHPDLYALDVAANILGQGRSSRLYRQVYVKKNLVHAISSSNYTPMDQGIFQVECLLEDKNAQAAIDAVQEEMEIMKNKGVSAQELKKAKRQVLSDHILDQQTTSGVAYSQAIDEAFAGNPQFSRKYVEAIREVSNQDIQRVAREYLEKDARTIVILRPKMEFEEKKIQTQTQGKGIIQKFTLNNGLTLLLKEDHTFPSVSLRLVLNGGTREEPVELNGISNLTALTWLKGTKSKSAEEIAQLMESLGMRGGGFSGRNSFGVHFEFLSEDTSQALNLLEDLVKNPLFPMEYLMKLKENVKADIRQREDDIFAFTEHALRETLFLDHPFRLDETGSLESVEKITREDIEKFYQRLAVPRNMVISIFGDINADEILTRIKKQFGTIPDKEITLTRHKESPLETAREKQLSMEKEQAMVMFGFQGPSIGSQDRYPLEILTSILGSSFSGRLFSTVREHLGQAYTLGGNFVPALDAGFIYFYVLTTEENTEAVKKILSEEILKLQKEDVPVEELKMVKTYLKGNFKIDNQTNDSLNFTTALDELYGLGWEHYLKFDQVIEEVTVEDIRRVALEYLDLNKTAIIVTKPNHIFIPHFKNM